MNQTFLYGGHVHANGIRQHYLRYCASDDQLPVLIVVPGITSPAITWEFVAERLGHVFDTYVLDVRGRGLSETGDHLDYGIDTCADDIIAFAEALDLNKYSILGHSMGARFAIRAATRNADGIDKLVLVDPPVSGPGRREYPSKLPWYIDSMKACRHGADIETMRTFCPTWTDEQLRLRAEWLHTCNEKAVIDTFNGFHEDDIHQNLPSLKVPALLMVAGKGGVIQEKDEKEISTLMPSIQIAHVPDAGHMIPWDDYEGFFAALGDFLGKKA
ncbi:MAG: alpha/beta hydrolase [Saccharospirillum sp.]|nr:alpha/beta hydrolase [Saccharospirillum sp.]